MNAPTNQQGADPGQSAAGLDLDDPNGVMAALNAAIADGKHTEGCKFETTCTCWKAKCRDARTKLRAALSAPSQGPADPDHAIGDEEESADLHMQWASDGDDLEASFNKLHAYAIRLEERLAAHPVPAAPAAPVDVIAMEAALIPIFKQCLRDSGEGDDEQHAREYTVDAIKALRGLATHPGSASTGAGRARGEEGAGDELSFSTQEGRIRVTFPPGMDEGKLSLAMLEAADFLVAPGVESGDELGSASAEPQRAFGQIRERMAEACHTQWSGWMKYLFSKCEILPNADKGDISVIPEWAVQRWKRQMDTAYPNLSEQEKDSDRKEADWLLALLGEAPPTSGEAEQSHQVTNHKEAFELAQIKKAKSNLARCYLELREATPGATVQPQADNQERK